MKEKSKLIIISNEKIFTNTDGDFCDNVDIKTIFEGMSKKFDIDAYCRHSLKKKIVKVNLNKIFFIKNILSFIKSIYKIITTKNKKILYISIHPFSFCFFIFISLFRNNSYVYLRSDGFKEYEIILGKKWTWVYKIMYSIITNSSKIISCHNSLGKGKNQILVNPSEIDNDWLKNIKEASLEYPQLLYVGRIKIEKGIHSLIKIIKKMNTKIQLTIIGNGEDKLQEEKSYMKLIPFLNKKEELIEYYDGNNIVILPSFTEAHPKIVDEALARSRPVIIFEEIKHIIGERKGIFVSQRNEESLKKTIFHVISNYKTIQNDIKQNKLPTKEKFLNELEQIIIYH